MEKQREASGFAAKLPEGIVQPIDSACKDKNVSVGKETSTISLEEQLDQLKARADELKKELDTIRRTIKNRRHKK